MGKITINVDMDNLQGAFHYTFKGATATKECICIPSEWLSVDKKGHLKLTLAGYEDHKFNNQQYSLKQKLTKAQYDAFKESGQGNYTPYVGNVYGEDEGGYQPNSTPLYKKAEEMGQQGEATDLPF